MLTVYRVSTRVPMIYCLSAKKPRSQEAKKPRNQLAKKLKKPRFRVIPPRDSGNTRHASHLISEWFM